MTGIKEWVKRLYGKPLFLKKVKTKFSHILPHVGKRILKSSFSVLLCYVVYLLRGRNGIPFYSMLAALWCIRPLIGNTLEMAAQRTLGTITGAVYGLVVLIIKQQFLPQDDLCFELLYYLLVALAIIPIIQTTVALKHQNASYFSCVVFLSIVVIHVGDENPFFFVLNRVIDTMVGIGIGIGINAFHMPAKKQRDILFVSGMDDTLIAQKEQLSTYSKRELNFLIDDGANFTISTMRTPASLQKVLEGIHLHLPIIAMDGAVLYDMNTNQFIKTVIMSPKTSKELKYLMEEYHLHCFANVIVDDCLLIYHEVLENEGEKKVYEALHTSPYRNYIKAPMPEDASVVYYMMIAETEKIQHFYQVLKQQKWHEKLKILCYPSKDYPGFSYIKIYNKNATRENMLDYLKQMTGLEKTITFGSLEEKYDVIIKDDNTDQVARTLKKMYHIPVWRKQNC